MMKMKYFYSLFDTDKAPGVVELQVVERSQGAAGLRFAGTLLGVTARNVQWTAGRAPGAAEGQSVQEDCR